MKKLINLLVLICITTNAFAQSPEFTSYQAVIRDVVNTLVVSQNVTIRISILKDSADGTVVYQETQNTTTNTNGLISIKIGAGTIVSGSFASINWGNGTYFIKTETDPTGTSNYTISGTSQFLSVPYAMYAKTSGSASTSWTTNASNLYNANSGNVGIGTINPTTKLHVSGGAINVSNIDGTGGNIYGVDVNHGIYFREGGNDLINYYEYGGSLAEDRGHRFLTGGATTSQTLKMQIANDGVYMAGNLGIGTTTPTSKLHIKNGTLKIDNGSNPYTLPTSDGSNGQILTTDGSGATSWDTAANNSNWSVSGNNINNANSGNVGIGTTAPTSKVHIKNGTLKIDNGSNPYTLPTADGSNGQVLKTDGAGNTSWNTVTSENNVFTDGVQDPTVQGSYLMWNKDGGEGRTHLINHKGAGLGGFKFEEASNDGSTRTTNMLLTGDGKLGIGTTAPTQKFDVVGGNARINNLLVGDVGHGSDWAGLSYGSSTTGFALIQSSDRGTTIINKEDNADGSILFRVANSDKMVINNDGNVGVGTASPTSKLHVIGSFKQEGGNFTLGGNLDVSVDADGIPGGRFKITNDGNVGIGTTVPTSKLHIKNGTLKIDDGSNPYTLPTSDGSNGQILTTDGSGNTSWGTFSNSDNWLTRTSGENGFLNLTQTGTGDINIVAVDDANLVFKTNNVEKMRVAKNGNVGIGTFAPTEKLDVNGTIKATALNINDNYNLPTTDGTSGQQLTTDGAGNVTWGAESEQNAWLTRTSGVNGFLNLTQTGTGDMNIIAQDDANLVFKTNNDEKMRVAKNGNVGIGTSTPAESLEVNGTIKATALNINDNYNLPTTDGTSGQQLTTDGAGNVTWGAESEQNAWLTRTSGVNGFLNLTQTGTGDMNIIAQDDANLVFKTNNDEKMRVAKNGNVGIGTGSPTEKLEVNGTIKATALDISGVINTTAIDVSKGLTPVGLQNEGSGVSPTLNMNVNFRGDNVDTASKGAALRIDTRDSENLFNFFSRDAGTSGIISEKNLMVINNDGNVGIGTTSPGSKLEINGSFKQGGGAFSIGGAHDFDIDADGVYGGRLRVTSAGNVGIGANLPTTKLQINSNGAPTATGGLKTGLSIAAMDVTDGLSLNLGVDHSGAYTWLQSAQIANGQNTQKLALNPLGGNVGVGTASPTSKLHVIGSFKQEGGNFTLGGNLDVSVDADGIPGGRFKITNDGNVGIGTTSPTQKLDVSGQIAVNGVSIITAGGINPSINTRILQNISADPSGTHQDGMYINYNSTGTTNNKVRFFTDGTTERMTINNDGNVGIGITEPSAKLHVEGSYEGHVAIFVNNNTSTGDGLLIKINKNDTDDSNEFVTFQKGNGAIAGQISGFQFPSTFDPTPKKADGTAIFPDFQFLFDLGKTNVGTDFSASTSAKIVLNSAFTNFKNALDTSAEKTAFFNKFFDTSMDLTSLGLGNPASFQAKLTSIPGHQFPYGMSFNGGSLPSIGNWGSVFHTGSLPGLTVHWTTLPHELGKINVPVDLPEIPMLVPKVVNDLMAGGVPFFGSTATAAASNYWEFHKWKLRNGYEDLFDSESAEDFALAGLNLLAADLANDGGVTYGSEGADYAEWLPKKDTLVHFNMGEIVAVKNGKLSKNTEDFDNIMIVSSRPIVLGNTPPAGEEANYEKVGFMGQVSTLVKGKVNVGDYIIPSGDNDGFAVGVSPENITVADIPKIAGKAWSATKNHVFDFVNVAVGLSTGEMAIIMQKQQEKMKTLEARLKALEDENTKLNEEVTTSISSKQYKNLLKRIKNLEKK